MKKIESSIRTCNILGVEIAEINMQMLVNYTEKHIKELAGEYICVSNVHTTVMSYEDSAYKKIQNNAVLALPDGGPLSSIGRKRGYIKMERTTGPDYMEEVLKISEKKKYTHFFYGSTEDTLTKLSEVLSSKYPNVEVVGKYSPPFRTLTLEEDKRIIEMINTVNPDFVWVGLGAPKQERWMAAHKNEITALMVGVGAAFDYFAGNISRAPQWMQRLNLEWLYRLLQDPKRLFKRYFVTNTKFLWHAVLRGR